MSNRFIEHPDRRGLNNGIARKAKVAPADLADGRDGVLVVVGKSLTVFSMDQAQRLRDELDKQIGASRAEPDTGCCRVEPWSTGAP